jgi:hypothetical protein
MTTDMERCKREIERIEHSIANYTPSAEVLETAAVVGNNRPVVADFEGLMLSLTDHCRERDWLLELELIELRKARAARRDA